MRLLVVSLLFVASTIDAIAQGAGSEYRPSIPKVWDDALVSSMGLSLPAPGPTVRDVSSLFYYSIPPTTIYRSYRVYSREEEPPGYRKWLGQQEPIIAFDPAQLKSEADWMAAGKLVFYTPGQRYVEATEAPEKAEPWMRYFIRTKGVVELGLRSSCAFCHAAVLSDGTVVDGAQRNYPGTYPAALPSNIEARRDLLQALFGTPWFNPDPNADPNSSDTEIRSWGKGAGFTDRVGASQLSPVQIPNLIGLKDRKYFDHSGGSLNRGVGDVMRYAALAAIPGMETLRSYGDFMPRGVGHKTLPAAETFSRFSDEQLYALALYLYSLKFPPNPNSVTSLTKSGERVFQRQGCPSCHTPPLYTNNKLISTDGFQVPPDHRRKYDILDVRLGLDPYLTTQTRRASGYYKVPSLQGVWMRSALEHNGSITSLEEWFNPARLRPEYAPTGFRGRQPARPVTGHQFGLDLPHDEKAALIAFLRTL